ncbi:MAG: agmatine deiminase family protein [Bacteroidetes bacterium]|nr:agmatine deiminase family protein [Bacteroidota bacterium]
MKTQIKIGILCFSLLFISINTIKAQQNNNARFHKPAYQTVAEKAMYKNTADLNKTDLYKSFPSQFVVPGEFEESQAVAISWAFDYNNNGVIIGVDTAAPYGYISEQLCDAIQPECAVWIRINKSKDSTTILNYMKRIGKPLYNYKFFVAIGDDWWTRDYGPMAFYYGKDDSIGFTDMKYYSGRDLDNQFPKLLAAKVGYKNFVTKLDAEGGNLMADGFGTMFFSTVIGEENADSLNKNPKWSEQQTLDTIRNVFSCPKLVNLTKLSCDGGTGHIDMYTKLLDEQTILLGRYSSEITANDKKVIDDNRKVMEGLTSTYNRPYRIIDIEMPTDDDGNYSNTTCEQIDQDARTFVNGITVNKSFIYPSYYDGLTGNEEQHNRVLQYLYRQMPGYKMIPIDSRDITTGGGAIHCITMQIPAENPIRFWHPSVDGLQPIISKYHVLAKITNKSGIKDAKCYWKKNNTTWNEVILSDSSGYFVGDIALSNLTEKDYIQYYIKATSNNGKVSTKPITAPGGYYYFYFKEPTSSIKNITRQSNNIFEMFPNPAKQLVSLKFTASEKESIQIIITDLSSKEVYSKLVQNTVAGANEETINLNGFNSGMYFCTIKSNDTVIGTKKLVVME